MDGLAVFLIVAGLCFYFFCLTKAAQQERGRD